MQYRDIQRRETTKEERRAIRAEYNSWRNGDIEIGGWSWKRWRKWAFSNQRGKCFYCRKPKKLPTMQVDHRVAVFYGGPNDISNFILACAPCNGFKAQHVLLRKETGRERQELERAAVTRPHRIDYAPQERAYATALNAVLDEWWLDAVARDD